MDSEKYRSVFSPATRQERKQNFEHYWVFTQQHGGELFENDKDLAKKRAKLRYFQDNPVQLRKPLADREVFYRNYIDMQDEPKSLDRITLMLTGIYKFARHEWVGVKGAWDAVPDMAHLPWRTKSAACIWLKNFAMFACLTKCSTPAV